MVKICLCGLAGLLLLSACSSGGPDGLTLSDFDFLRLGMSYAEVVAEVGEAGQDVGSGIHIIVYDLADETELMLSFASFDSLMAVHLYHPDTGSRELILGSDS